MYSCMCVFECRAVLLLAVVVLKRSVYLTNEQQQTRPETTSRQRGCSERVKLKRKRSTYLSTALTIMMIVCMRSQVSSNDNNHQRRRREQPNRQEVFSASQTSTRCGESTARHIDLRCELTASTVENSQTYHDKYWMDCKSC